MTEAELFAKIRLWFIVHGHPTRIENVLSQGMPDVIYATEKGLMFIELKIEHARKIKLETFQIPFAMACLKWLPPGLYWFCVLRSWGAIHLLDANDILEGEMIPVKDGVTISLDDMPISTTIDDANSVGKWLALI